MKMSVCTVCKKKFIPAAEHLYKTKDGKQCSYTCWNKAKTVVDKPRASTRRRQG